ncbi:MAG: cation-translocating P-type ATPase [Desulfobacter postgatei]|uniref:cation-translocating P-type ATPase n=1 Tax=Desulfobacter postgatei TaxID=2293 RepID=UPI0023F3CBF7|nr:cation-translocating P-type ATPase [Desulfobacter postgatei]MDD4273663.1 cation-translocating P-type ATPase [Desulfobacter postgatei]
MIYYRETIETVLSHLKVTRHGLDEKEVEARREQHGLNQLEVDTSINPLLVFIDQFKSFIIYILLFAVVFSLLIGEYVDSIIILIILLSNAFIGFFQELSAHKSLESLKKMTTIQTTVIRDGVRKMIDAKYLVPGDIFYLEAGDKVPADGRIINAVRLKVEESALTGESVPVEKTDAPINADVQMGSQTNMLFASTAVVTGNTLAVAISTGMQTQIGRITSLIKEAKEEMTPLQRRLDVFGRKLGYAILSICFVVFLAYFTKEFMGHGTISGHTFIAFAFIAISLAVAAVPTALPAVVTIALSVGVKRLLRKKALVRKLSSVETLGSCDIICTDKTGTLTENQMTVRHAWTFDSEASLTGAGYNPQGELSQSLNPLLFHIGFVCNNATLNQKEGTWMVTGDPTEAALIVSAIKSGYDGLDQFIRKDELPFDSGRKLMSVLTERNEKKMVLTKGAPDQILKRCQYVLIDGKPERIDERMRAQVIEQNDIYASRALRVLAFAYKEVRSEKEFNEDDLVFVGLQAMIDPPRPDVIEAIKKTQGAGIRTIMITGDYKETAKAIGREIGIVGKVLTGDDIETMTDKDLEGVLKDETNIFARVMPEHKQRIVSSLQQLGHMVAMTGDGVNDAPALKKANIGIAVGSGTDVAKDASDFVLLDDSFTHIVNAIEEGRGIYDNIQKSIMLLLSGNVGEVLIIFLAAVFGLNLPLTAILLLWINMVTDGAPALAYSVDPYGHNIMHRKPKPLNEGILPVQHLTLIGVLGVIGTVIALFLFERFGGNSSVEEELRLAQTMVFNFVVLYETILVFIIRKSYKVPLFSNGWVWASVALSLGLQALLMYTPLYDLFKIVPLGMSEIGWQALGGVAFYAMFLIYHYVSSALLFKKSEF